MLTNISFIEVVLSRFNTCDLKKLHTQTEIINLKVDQSLAKISFERTKFHCTAILLCLILGCRLLGGFLYFRFLFNLQNILHLRCYYDRFTLFGKYIFFVILRSIKSVMSQSFVMSMLLESRVMVAFVMFVMAIVKMFMMMIVEMLVMFLV